MPLDPVRLLELRPVLSVLLRSRFFTRQKLLGGSPAPGISAFVFTRLELRAGDLFSAVAP